MCSLFDGRAPGHNGEPPSVAATGEKLPSLAAKIGLIAVKHNTKNCHLFPLSGPGVMKSEVSTKNAVCESRHYGTQRPTDRPTDSERQPEAETDKNRVGGRGENARV